MGTPFHNGFRSELEKLAGLLDMIKGVTDKGIDVGPFTVPHGVAKGYVSTAAGSHGKETANAVMDRVGKYKKEIVGTGAGALAGKSLGKIPGLKKVPIRGAAGALLGLLASKSGDIAKHIKDKK